MTANQQFPRLGASACVWHAGRVLLIERARPPGVWSLPGGHVELGETTAAAAARELAEETGVTARLDAFVGLFDVIRRDRDGKVLLHYAVACYAGHATQDAVLAASDAKAALWVWPQEVVRFSLAPNVQDAIDRAQRILSV